MPCSLGIVRIDPLKKNAGRLGSSLDPRLNSNQPDNPHSLPIHENRNFLLLLVNTVC
jgi:hypothetical protein